MSFLAFAQGFSQQVLKNKAVDSISAEENKLLYEQDVLKEAEEYKLKMVKQGRRIKAGAAVYSNLTEQANSDPDLIPNQQMIDKMLAGDYSPASVEKVTNSFNSARSFGKKFYESKGYYTPSPLALEEIKRREVPSRGSSNTGFKSILFGAGTGVSESDRAAIDQRGDAVANSGFGGFGGSGGSGGPRGVRANPDAPVGGFTLNPPVAEKTATDQDTLSKIGSAWLTRTQLVEPVPEGSLADVSQAINSNNSMFLAASNSLFNNMSPKQADFFTREVVSNVGSLRNLVYTVGNLPDYSNEADVESYKTDLSNVIGQFVYGPIVEASGLKGYDVVRVIMDVTKAGLRSRFQNINMLPEDDQVVERADIKRQLETVGAATAMNYERRLLAVATKRAEEDGVPVPNIIESKEFKNRYTRTRDSLVAELNDSQIGLNGDQAGEIVDKYFRKTFGYRIPAKAKIVYENGVGPLEAGTPKAKIVYENGVGPLEAGTPEAIMTPTVNAKELTNKDVNETVNLVSNQNLPITKNNLVDGLFKDMKDYAKKSEGSLGTQLDLITPIDFVTSKGDDEFGNPVLPQEKAISFPFRWLINQSQQMTNGIYLAVNALTALPPLDASNIGQQITSIRMVNAYKNMNETAEKLFTNSASSEQLAFMHHFLKTTPVDKNGEASLEAINEKSVYRLDSDRNVYSIRKEAPAQEPLQSPEVRTQRLQDENEPSGGPTRGSPSSWRDENEPLKPMASNNWLRDTISPEKEPSGGPTRGSPLSWRPQRLRDENEPSGGPTRGSPLSWRTQRLQDENEPFVGALGGSAVPDIPQTSTQQLQPDIPQTSTQQLQDELAQLNRRDKLYMTGEEIPSPEIQSEVAKAIEEYSSHSPRSFSRVFEDKSVEEIIKDNEGFRSSVYDDDGYPAIGYGTRIGQPDIAKAMTKMFGGRRFNNIKKGRAKITKEEATDIFNAILPGRIAEVRKVIPNFDDLPKIAKIVVFDRAYNIGITDFKKGSPLFIQAIIDNNWLEAIRQMVFKDPQTSTERNPGSDSDRGKDNARMMYSLINGGKQPRKK